MQNNNYLSLINFKVKLHRQRLFLYKNTPRDTMFTTFKKFEQPTSYSFFKKVSDNEVLLWN